LKFCCHCGIAFLTDPRNRGRNDIGCPFGCRQAHSKEKSAQRSTNYYRNEEGKQKKKQHNSRRNRQHQCSPLPQQTPPALNQAISPAVIPDSTVDYLRILVSLIERRRVKRREIIDELEKIWRQHSFTRFASGGYICDCNGFSP